MFLLSQRLKGDFIGKNMLQATITTMVSSFGGGIFTLVMSYYQHDGKIDVLAMINGVLGALVGVTGLREYLNDVTQS